MSEPIKLPVFIAVVVAAVVIFGLIGYKFIIANNPPQRTDAAARDIVASYAQARTASGKGTPPASTPQGK